MKKNKLSITRLPALAVLITVFALITIPTTLLVLSPTTLMAQDGDDINVHNNTGHRVDVFLFMDDQVHTDVNGGVQFSSLNNGESAVAHVTGCKFSIVLVDGQDVWHGEYHDCNTLDFVFTPETGHTIKGQN